MEENQKILFPCFLCGNGLEVKLSKKNKPYFICEPCGIQVFIRREKGRTLLYQLLESLGKNTVNMAGAAGRTLDVLALVNRLAHLKAKVQEMQDRQGFWESMTGEGSLATAERALRREIAQIEAQLESLATEG